MYAAVEIYVMKDLLLEKFYSVTVFH